MKFPVELRDFPFHIIGSFGALTGGLIEFLEGVIDFAYPPPQIKELAADTFLNRIPVLNRDKHFMKNDYHKPALCAEIG